MADPADTVERTGTRTLTDRPAALTALVVGGLLAFLGIAPPLVAGAEGDFLGFGRNYLHDAIHLLTGLAGLAAGYYAGGRFAHTYNLAMGIVYALVTLLGIVATDLMVDLVSLNAADNALHFALAAALLGAWYYFDDRGRRT